MFFDGEELRNQTGTGLRSTAAAECEGASLVSHRNHRVKTCFKMESHDTHPRCIRAFIVGIY